MPEVARESIENWVIFSDSINMAFVRLVVSFSITSLVASGVTSLGEKPLPPVVKIRFNSSESLHSMSFF